MVEDIVKNCLNSLLLSPLPDSVPSESLPKHSASGDLNKLNHEDDLQIIFDHFKPDGDRWQRLQ